MRGYLVIVAFALLALTKAEEIELYSDKYDYIDVNEVLANDRLREQYYKCFMDTAPCVTPDAAFYKSNFPETIVTKCKRCTEKQKENLNKTAEWYSKHQPEKWNALVEKMFKEAKKFVDNSKK